MLAPMIKHLRNVTDRPCALGGAQRKIIVLGQIEFAAKPDVEGERAAIGAQVPDIHEAAEQLRAPFRFEKGIVPLPLGTQSIFVAVKNIRPRTIEDGSRQFVKSERRDNVVMIEARHEISRCHAQRPVRVRGDSQIVAQFFEVNPFVAVLPATESLQRSG